MDYILDMPDSEVRSLLRLGGMFIILTVVVIVGNHVGSIVEYLNAASIVEYLHVAILALISIFFGIILMIILLIGLDGAS